MLRLITVVLISFMVAISTAIMAPGQEKALVDGLLKNYDGTVRPQGENRTASGSYPVNVQISMFLRSINSVDDVKMTWETQAIFRMQWLDERLKFRSEDGKYLSMPPGLGQKLWKPDLFFGSEIEYRQHEGLAPNEYYRVFPDGQVLFSSRITMKLPCPMTFKLYPHDSQTCSLRMASYAYTTDDIVFEWKPVSPVQVTADLHMAKFSLRRFTTDHCDSQTNTGTYSCLRLDLLFRRELSQWVTKVFIPMIIAILIIWLSMLINPVGNGNSVVRALILGAGGFYCKWSAIPAFNGPLPAISYSTCFDGWCFLMDIFILVALVEFVIVVGLSQGKQEHSNGRCTPLYNGIDFVCRIMYPAALLGIIVLYCVSYTIGTEEGDEMDAE